MITIVFSFIWGIVTAWLGVGWFDGDILAALIANGIPITFVYWLETYT